MAENWLEMVKKLKSFKSSNKEKLLLKLVVESCLTALRAAPEQMSIPLNKFPCIKLVGSPIYCSV